jgi:hypothetical protein
MIPELKTVFIIGELIIIAAYIGLMCLSMVPADARELAQAVIMLMAGHLGTYANYEWGSSAGSRQKDDTIARAVENGHASQERQ